MTECEYTIPGSSKDPFEADYRKCWRSAAGAYFALLVREHLAKGLFLTDENRDRFFEEAAMVGRAFAERAGE